MEILLQFVTFFFHIPLFQVFSWMWQEDVPVPHELRELSCANQIFGPSWFSLWVCVGPAVTERRELMYTSSFSSSCGAGCVFAFTQLSSSLYVCITYPYGRIWKPSQPTQQNYQYYNETSLHRWTSGKRQRDSKHFKIQSVTHRIFLTHSIRVTSLL